LFRKLALEVETPPTDLQIDAVHVPESLEVQPPPAKKMTPRKKQLATKIKKTPPRSARSHEEDLQC
jgi:hypothetical protein